jgi:hypothetical protein
MLELYHRVNFCSNVRLDINGSLHTIWMPSILYEQLLELEQVTIIIPGTLREDMPAQPRASAGPLWQHKESLYRLAYSME